LTRRLARHSFVAGDDYAVADITAQVTVDLMRLPKISLLDDCWHVARWHADASARPRAGA